MRISILVGVSTLALSLAACGSENSGEYTTEDGENVEYSVDRDSGETSVTVDTPDGEVSMRSGAEVPVDLPAGFSLIGGAKVISNTVFSQAGGKGALVTFTTDKSPQEIVDFYRAEAEAAGIAIQIESSINGGKMLGGENESNGTTFSVTAYPSDDDGVTTGQLTIGNDLG